MKFFILGFIISICAYLLGKEHGKNNVKEDIIRIICYSNTNENLIRRLGQYFGDEDAF